MTDPVVRSGSTKKGQGWTHTDGASTIEIKVDTSAAGFTSVPVYVASLGFDASQEKAAYTVTGIDAVYEPSAKGFTLHLQRGGHAPSVDEVDRWGWVINWVGVAPG
jgi:hypothetical protein